MTQDTMHQFKQEQPTVAHYWVFHNSDGSSAYYLTDMEEYHRYAAMYGQPVTLQWSYTTHQAGKVYGQEVTQ